MLSKANRLQTDQDYLNLIKRGRFIRSGYFNLRYLANKTNTSRFGFVISTKVDKRAVVRNLLKRRLRAIIRASLPMIIPGFDVMIVARNEALKLDYPAIRQDILVLLDKARIFKANVH